SRGVAVETIHGILGAGIAGGLAMIAIALGTVAVNALNDYTGSLSLQAAGVRVPRVVSAIVVAVAGFAFTLYLNSGPDFFRKFENYLLFLSYWIAPWAAIVLFDWWSRGAPVNVRALLEFRRLHGGAPALVALIAGFVVSLPFQTSAFGGELAKATGLPINMIAANNLYFADFAYLVGFVVAGVVFSVAARARRGTGAESEPRTAEAT
ncbi:MAG: hypothetical protein M3301_05295, partial [Chloroflexota bacterium]|nr:hypothetical protein [Chloroflexota bacterium]